jgi:hypothetical protein
MSSQIMQLPDLLANWPYPDELSGNYEEVRNEAAQWWRKHHVNSEKAILERIVSFDSGELMMTSLNSVLWSTELSIRYCD